MKEIKLILDFDQACLVRDGLTEIKQQLRETISARGQHLFRVANAMQHELATKILKL